MSIAFKPAHHFLTGFICLLVIYTFLQMIRSLPSESVPLFLKRLPNSPTRFLVLVSYLIGAFFLHRSGMGKELIVWHLVQAPLLAFIMLQRGYERLFGPSLDVIQSVDWIFIKVLRDYSLLFYLLLGLFRKARVTS